MTEKETRAENDAFWDAIEASLVTMPRTRMAHRLALLRTIAACLSAAASIATLVLVLVTR